MEPFERGGERLYSIENAVEGISLEDGERTEKSQLLKRSTK